jgi:uncharacterized membrane protein
MSPVADPPIATEMSDTPSPPADPDRPEGEPQAATIEELFSRLAGIATGTDDAETYAEVKDVKKLLAEAHNRGLIESGVRHLRPRDAAEALVGSVIFASPLLVEDGVFDIGAYLFEFTRAGLPVFLLANTLFVVFMTFALLKWTGRDKDETAMLFGVVPIRVFMVLGVSLFVATVLMTVWGRIDWSTPIEAIARINVIWTVGSLGAALGDILADSDTTVEVPNYASSPPAVDPKDQAAADASRVPAEYRELTDAQLMAELHDQFDDLEYVVDDSADRHEVNQVRQQTVTASMDDGFGDRIERYTPRDIAEAFVGSIFFSIPFLVEDGVFDVANYFLSFRVGMVPVFFLINAAFVLLMISALVYWAGPQDVQVSRPIFGFIPRRLVGTAIVSFLTTAALMTMWGRVAEWQDPVVALARVSVVWTVASFGAALGDILPGESSGDDINDDLAAIGELAGVDGPDSENG